MASFHCILLPLFVGSLMFAAIDARYTRYSDLLDEFPEYTRKDPRYHRSRNFQRRDPRYHRRDFRFLDEFFKLQRREEDCKEGVYCAELATFIPGFCRSEATYKKCRCTCNRIKSGEKYLRCGMKTNHRRVKRIIGGTTSTLGEWPWVVSINATMLNQKKSTLWCVGTILSENFILTARNGFDKDYVSLNPKDWSITAGHTSMDGNERGQQIRGIKRIIRLSKENRYVIEKTSGKHFAYLPHDIAILELSKPLRFSDNINSLCLIGPKDDGESSNCYIAGWGYKQYYGNIGGATSNLLQSVKMPVVSNKECNAESAYNGTIPENILCAGHKEGGKDGCNYDSGAGLACKGDDYWYEAGIMSSGYKCAQPNAYGLYAPVYRYRSWIINKILELK